MCGVPDSVIAATSDEGTGEGGIDLQAPDKGRVEQERVRLSNLQEEEEEQEQEQEQEQQQQQQPGELEYIAYRTADASARAVEDGGCLTKEQG